MTKKHIIDEIIRTAKENNGVPLGRDRFEKETGIRYADWDGRYWARWGDAVKEAGFEPNKMQGAYAEIWLIEQVILLICKIKRFPVRGEIRMESFNAKDFPSDKAIRRGLGNKSEMIQKILKYCKDKPEYQDVVEICKNAADDTRPEKDDDDAKEPSVQYGYVYLMKSGRYYKIGMSNTPEKRNYELGTKLAEEIKTLHTIKTNDPSGIEAYWHKRFEAKRKRGEWFDLSGGDVKAFKRRKFM